MQGFVNEGLVDEKTVCLTNIYSKKSYICNSSVVSKNFGVKMERMNVKQF